MALPGLDLTLDCGLHFGSTIHTMRQHLKIQVPAGQALNLTSNLFASMIQGKPPMDPKTAIVLANHKGRYPKWEDYRSISLTYLLLVWVGS